MGLAANHLEMCSAGAIIIEMTIVLWLLVFISVGIIDFGLVLEEHTIMQQAASSGAREAAKLIFRPINTSTSPVTPTVLTPTNAQRVTNTAIASAFAFLEQANLHPADYVVSVSAVSLLLPEAGSAPNPAVRVSIARRFDHPRNYFYTLPTNLSSSCAASTYRVHSRNAPVAACVIKACTSCTEGNAPVPCQNC